MGASLLRALFLRLHSLVMRSLVVLRSARLLFIAVAASIVAGAGCGADFDDGTQFKNDPPLYDSGTSGTLRLDSSVQDASSSGGRRVDPRCGSISTCDPGKIPDDPLACADYPGDPPTPPPRDGGRQVDGFDASPSPDGGVSDGGAAPVPDAPPVLPAEAGADGGGGGPEPGVEAGRAPPPGVPENSSGSHGEPFACQVSADSNGNPSHKCVRSGAGDDGAPCSSTNDCRAGFACVGEAGVGECRPYCCAMDENPCDTDHDGSTGTTVCGERLLLEPGRPPSLRVPVCVPAEVCKLDEKYPCVDGSQGCTCPADKACTVVPAGGTTFCAIPGNGKMGDACPCARGYFCSSQNQCVRMCKTTGVEDTKTKDPPLASCAPGKCQATVGFPDGFGVCVGTIQ